jgi:hypothetical protein
MSGCRDISLAVWLLAIWLCLPFTWLAVHARWRDGWDWRLAVWDFRLAGLDD